MKHTRYKDLKQGDIKMKLNYKYGKKAYEINGESFAEISKKLGEKFGFEARPIYRGLRRMRRTIDGSATIHGAEGQEDLLLVAMAGAPAASIKASKGKDKPKKEPAKKPAKKDAPKKKEAPKVKKPSEKTSAAVHEPVAVDPLLDVAM
jgi:hypothetical protein